MHVLLKQAVRTKKIILIMVVLFATIPLTVCCTMLHDVTAAMGTCGKAAVAIWIATFLILPIAMGRDGTDC